MQVEYHANLPRRVHDNWARLYQRQIGEGQRYGDHRPLVCIWIVDEDIPDRLLWLDGVHSSWISDNARYSREFFVIFLQLGRWRRLKSRDPDSTLEHLKSSLPGVTFSEAEGADVGRLASFLAESQNWDDERLPEGMGNSWVEEALKIMKTFTSDDAARDLYERRLEAERVHEDLILTGLQKGIAIGKNEGIAIGKNQGIAIGRNDALRDTALQLKLLGLAPGDIAKATGLSLEDQGNL
jgi:predicted transposase/invertase (TIGR01784 family)